MSSRLSTTLKSSPVTLGRSAAGVVPFSYSSGQYKGKAKTSNKANKQLNGAARAGIASQRCDVSDSTASAVRIHPKFDNITWEKLLNRAPGGGKNEMLVVNNVCNKIIHRVFSCVHRKEKYKDFYTPLVAWIIEIDPILYMESVSYLCGQRKTAFSD